MKCPKCSIEMIIDTWNGWVWYCFNCSHIDRDATDDEVKALEKEMLINT